MKIKLLVQTRISLTIIAYILQKQRFSQYKIAINCLLSPFSYALYYCLYQHSKVLILRFTIVSVKSQSLLTELLLFVIKLRCMDFNASLMSESLAISLTLEWKALPSFLFLYSEANIVWTLNFFHPLNNSFKLFLIQLQWRIKKIQDLNTIAMYTIIKKLDCIILAYFPLSSGVVIKI